VRGSLNFGMCLFCDIINKKLDSDFIFEDNEVIVISDIHPKAPVHMLIIPKKHIESVKEINEVEKNLLFKIIKTAKDIAETKQLKGFKLIFNVGKEGGQIVDHLHLHLLGGWDIKSQHIEV